MLMHALLLIVAVALFLLFALAVLPIYSKPFRARVALAPRKLRMLTISTVCLLLVLAFVLVACSAAQTTADVTAVEDISDAVCQELGANPQTEPAWVQFVCTKVPKAGGSPKTFHIKIPADQAKKFASDHCGDAKVSP